MSIVRYEPWSVINQLQGDLNKLFERRRGSEDSSMVETGHWVPLVDIKEEPNCFILYADIPGVDPENIEITMENGVLTIRGERTEEKKEEEKDYMRVERTKGLFYRRFSLPDTADAEGITAHGKHGVLEVVIPKREKAKARTIKVSSPTQKLEKEKEKTT